MKTRRYAILGNNGPKGTVEIFQHKRGFWTAKYVPDKGDPLFATSIREQTEAAAIREVEREGRNWLGDWENE